VTANAQAKGPVWVTKVEELAHRGFSLAKLLDFLELLFEKKVMPSFDPKRSTTNDVVRQVIIPCTRDENTGGGRAFASVWSGGQPVIPTLMITHAWDNRFLHLVAGIVADCLGERTYAHIAHQLLDSKGRTALRRTLQEREKLEVTCWVCAFSINQHASICGGFGPAPPEGTPDHAEWTAKTVDSTTLQRFTTCPCQETKVLNDKPEPCELNKFADMMAYLFEHSPGFVHTIVVDEAFNLFTRAWCVAETVQGYASGMKQSLVLHSAESVDKHYGELARLDVRACKASRAEDKDAILQAITNISAFNEHLQWIIFDPNGLFEEWADGEMLASSIGQLVRRTSTLSTTSSTPFSHIRHISTTSAMNASDSIDTDFSTNV
jgi:hypothetical protein